MGSDGCRHGCVSIKAAVRVEPTKMDYLRPSEDQAWRAPYWSTYYTGEQSKTDTYLKFYAQGLSTFTDCQFYQWKTQINMKNSCEVCCTPAPGERIRWFAPLPCSDLQEMEMVVDDRERQSV